MAVSLVIFEGPTPSKAKPVLATRDPYIIASLRRLLAERLEGKRPLKPSEGKEEGDQDEQ